MGQVMGNNSLARLWPLDSESMIACSMTVLQLKDLERKMCPVNFLSYATQLTPSKGDLFFLNNVVCAPWIIV